MPTLGVFRDDYYSPASILPVAKYVSTTQASGVIPAANLVGGTEVYLATSGATALTLDSPANVITTLNQLLGNLSKAAPTPNITSGSFNFLLYVRNTNAGTLTITPGTGNTISGTATVATGVQRAYLVTVTGANAVSYQDLGGGAVT